jgi:hypothetical protein
MSKRSEPRTVAARTVRGIAWLAVVLVLIARNGAGAQERVGAPQAPSAVHYLMRFRLGAPYTDLWSADREAVDSGVLAVVALPPAEPPLGAGTQSLIFCDGGLAEPLNSRAGSGVVVVILPARCFRAHSDMLDASVWTLVSPELPERFLAKNVGEETNRLRVELGEPAVLRRALKRDAIVRLEEPQFFESKKALLRSAADLIRRYAPEDEHVAVGFSVPPERTFRLP